MDINSILVTDCGSTTTKAILVEKRDGVFRLAARGEAPTTVEAPAEDVTLGVLNAVRELAEIIGRPLLEDGCLIRPFKEGKGVDIYLSTSSAGGGLQMVVAGVVGKMSGESAQRAALGAGAVVLEVISSNDKRKTYEKIELIRKLRPDMVLLSGGVDGGVQKHVVELAQLFSAAEPRPRLGHTYKLPVIFAGNTQVQSEIKKILSQKTDLQIVDNIRPTLEEENLQPARLKIQEQFLEHVMAHAPGYAKLMEMTDEPIMPTPAAVGLMMQRLAEKHNINIVGVDIGGATTDVFSVFKGAFNRTVSANYGMSYSISNVLAEAGLANVERWLSFDISESQLRNSIKNKMIRPTSIPYLKEDLLAEQAICREALRLSFEQHRLLATDLKGVQHKSDIARMFDQDDNGQCLVNLMDLDMLIGSGGVLSHAPNRYQAALMLLDAFLPEGLTRLAVDSIFMMPQLGVLSQIHPQASTEVFENDCLVELGASIAPVGPLKPGKLSMIVTVDDKEYKVYQGELKLICMPYSKTAKVIAIPQNGLDLGLGKGKKLEKDIRGGEVGLILDGRGRRPFVFPEDKNERLNKVKEWTKVFEILD